MPSDRSAGPQWRLPPGAIPALCLVAGAVVGTFTLVDALWPLLSLLPLNVAAAVAWHRRARLLTCAALGAGFVAAALALAADARVRALEPSLRAVLDRRFGGFALHTLGPEADHDPVVVFAHLVEDAALDEGFVSLRALVTAVEMERISHEVSGGVLVSVAGQVAVERAGEWRAGRLLRLQATFRRPARFLNEGVPDFERDLALDGTTLFASVKSGLLVDVVATGSLVEEAAARVRAHVRRVVHERVSPHGAISAAIVTAILIGDRTGLPSDVRERLQAAGTYHVIAISGGNIAILAATTIVIAAIAGIRGRAAAVVTIAVLLAYAQVVTPGPSVWRATLMAVLYFTARALDLGAAPWQVAAVAAGLMVVVHPLDVRDVGFVLTFGATAALLEGARRARRVAWRHRALGWLAASIVASLSTEAALLPVSAQLFSRVTCAGLVLNLLAVPLMTLVQLAGMTLVLCNRLDPAAEAAGVAAHAAAAALVGSARLVEAAPWLTARLPPPGLLLILFYYASLAAVLWTRRRVRVAAAVALAAAIVGIVSGVQVPARGPRCALTLCVTVFDVGQAESVLLEAGGRALLVDAGGSPFGGRTFDIGARVLAPALWTRGLRRIDALLLTHGDPDHLGGAEAVIGDFAPRQIWEGIRVPPHVPMQHVREAAARQRAPAVAVRPGDAFAFGPARVRVLHPPEPDWERPRVRNDDSVVLEVRAGDVAILLTGDVSAEIERAILPLLTPARVRVLKVAHHGSRTSTSRELLDHWRPQIALVSAGRGNTFGHPAPEVLRRLEAIGASVFRTDRDGEIRVMTDGRSVAVKTYTGRSE